MKSQGGGQGLYRGGENKKVKLSKAEKVFNAIQKDQIKANALKAKSETNN